MAEEKMVKLLSPPMVFWGIITNDQWDKMSEEDQDILIEAAKLLLKLDIYGQSSPDRK